ncbi:hypothetical protein MAR_036143 [Mya arenaria]|uniref:Uncharacterized protein n=1 Tax=Mya arenaria TaxID=6604 RepID=A0ABY7EQ34_MYAAR|nr:hypothetical protein MAR_036143 [Mya arenaria]
MSHNAKFYTKKIDKKAAAGSKKIDVLFKQSCMSIAPASSSTSVCSTSYTSSETFSDDKSHSDCGESSSDSDNESTVQKTCQINNRSQ